MILSLLARLLCRLDRHAWRLVSGAPSGTTYHWTYRCARPGCDAREERDDAFGGRP